MFCVPAEAFVVAHPPSFMFVFAFVLGCELTARNLYYVTPRLLTQFGPLPGSVFLFRPQPDALACGKTPDDLQARLRMSFAGVLVVIFWRAKM